MLHLFRDALVISGSNSNVGVDDRLVHIGQWMILVLFGFTILQCIICHIGAYPLFVEITNSWSFVFYLS